MNKDPLEKYKYKEKLVLDELKLPLIKAQKVTCPSCNKPVPSDNLNIQTSVAKCNSCDVIFSFHDNVSQLSNQHNITQEILQPEGVELNRFRNELDISVEQPWRGIEILIISIFPLLVLIASIIIIESLPATDITKTVMITFWLTSLIAYISYFFVRKRHKTYIHIDDLNLYIEQRPRKLIKDKRYAIKDIDQVYIRNVASGSSTKASGIFMIVNHLNGQKQVELIKSVNNRSKAKYIEQEIERQLGITDRRVPDEED